MEFDYDEGHFSLQSVDFFVFEAHVHLTIVFSFDFTHLIGQLIYR